MGNHDIGIAGCGIAGLAAALLLARDGHRVTVYERFESPQPVGSGLLLQPTGLAVLDRLGLAEHVARKGAPVRRLYGENSRGARVLDARYGDLRIQGVFGVGLKRSALFDALFQAAVIADISFETGRDVAGFSEDRPRLRLEFADGTRSRPHDLVVDCMGVATPLSGTAAGWLPFGALWANIPCGLGDQFAPDVLEQRYDRARRMAGVLPVGGGAAALFWSLRTDRRAGWEDAGLSRWKAEVERLWPATAILLERISDPAQLTFARYAHRTAGRRRSSRLLPIGDAWHSASPQLGQGANMALLDAWALATAMRRSDGLDESLALFLKLRSGHVRLYQLLTRLFTPLYQSDALLPAVVRDILLAPLSRVGIVGRIQSTLVAGLAGNPLPALDLSLPDYPALSRVAERHG